MKLIPNQIMDVITLREARNNMIPMLPNPLGEIGCYADVEGSVLVAGEDIDAGVFVHDTCLDV